MLNQLDKVHKHLSQLIEVLESVVREQPFFLFVDRAKPSTSQQAHSKDCLLAIKKQSSQDSRMALASAPKAFRSYTIDSSVSISQVNHVYIGTATKNKPKPSSLMLEEDICQRVVSENMGKRTRSVMEFACCALGLNQNHM